VTRSWRPEAETVEYVVDDSIETNEDAVMVVEPPGLGESAVTVVVELVVVDWVDAELLEPPGFGLSVVEAPGFP
jgi:hypothetical protein